MVPSGSPCRPRVYRAVFVEANQKSFLTLVENLRALDAGPQAVLHRMDAVKYATRLAEREFDVAFADPPYRLGLAEEIARLWLATPFAGVLGIEHEKQVELPEGGDRRVYGDTVVTFYRRP